MNTVIKEDNLLFFRVLWFVAVLVAVTLFLYQVGMRTQQYFQYNTNINVEVKFEPQLEFPSVTVCNQNSFRSAATKQQFVLLQVTAIYAFIVAGACLGQWWGD